MSRRGNQEGTYQNLPNGKIRMAMMVDGHRVYGKPGANKVEARANLKAKLEERNRIEPEYDPNFATFYYSQLPRLKSELAPNTYAMYVNVYESLVNTNLIGGIRLSELSPQHVQNWVDAISDKKPRTVARYLECIKGILTYAVKTHRLDKNPAQPIKPPKAEEHHKDVLTKTRVDELLKMEMSDRLRTAILLCLHGLRRAEACGLKFEDFDGDGITIRRQALEVDGELIIRDATKTGGTRWVPVDNRIKAILKNGEGWVLGTSTGQPLRPRNLAREWSLLVDGDPEFVRKRKIETKQPIKEATKFAGITLHDLRSTFGTLLLEKGVDVRTAAEILGHSPAMLSAIYARSRKELKQEALGKVFG